VQAIYCVMLLAATGLNDYPGKDVEVNLHGPSPTAGTVFRTTEKFEIKDAELTEAALGIRVQGKMSMSASSESEIKILSLDRQKVTSFQTKHIKDEAATTTTIAGETIKFDEVNDLAGAVVLSVKGAAGWTHSLLDAKPTEKQRKALALESGWDDHEDIPEGKQAIGRSWEVDATHLKGFLRPQFTSLSGKAKKSFIRLEEHRGEICAVIETVGRTKGKIDMGGTPATLDFEWKAMTFRALRLGIDVKMTFTGTLRLVGKVDDIGAGTELKGTFTGEELTTVLQSSAK
jgi:hypothetical protein